MALAGAPRIARCEQNVWRRMWTPGFTFARLATRRIITWMTFCVSGCPCLSQSTRVPRRSSHAQLPLGQVHVRPLQCHHLAAPESCFATDERHEISLRIASGGRYEPFVLVEVI